MYTDCKWFLPVSKRLIYEQVPLMLNPELYLIPLIILWDFFKFKLSKNKHRRSCVTEPQYRTIEISINAREMLSFFGRGHDLSSWHSYQNQSELQTDIGAIMKSDPQISTHDNIFVWHTYLSRYFTSNYRRRNVTDKDLTTIRASSNTPRIIILMAYSSINIF